MSAAEHASAHALMDAVLRGDGTLAAEYPLVFGAGAPGRTVCAQRDGAVRSSCAILARDLIVPGAELRVGLIGSVATEADYRGRGLASGVLERAERALRAEGCEYALLWADEPGFYATRGYRPASAELVWPLEAGLLAHLPPADAVRPARDLDAPAIHALYERHPLRVRRTAAETALLLAIPGMQLLVREREGRVVAYACVGRGADLGGVLHEWGGAPEDVLACARVPLARAGSLFLMTPAARDALCARLEQLGATAVRGVLGLAKPLTTAAAAAFDQRIGPQADPAPFVWGLDSI